MSKNYKQLSPEQRYQIEALKAAGNNQKTIAQIIGVHPSTICREFKRNIPKAGTGRNEYRAKNAQRRTRLRHMHKPKKQRFTDEMKRYALTRLKDEKFSPELISVTGKSILGYYVSHETIYKWIWECKKRNTRKTRSYKFLYRHLAHGRRRRKRGNRHDSRGIIHHRVSIEKRPAIVEKRKRFGDIEVDMMLGRNHKGTLVVMTDRATLKTKIKLTRTKEAEEITAAIKQKLRSLKSKVKTLTFDNDQAFKNHLSIGKYLKAQTYFTRPYTSQDKGTVENRIGIIRRFLPKRTDLSKVSLSQVRKIESLINNRPVRKFKYKTPNHVFSEKIALVS